MVALGFEVSVPFQHNQRFVSPKEDFFELFPRKTILQLHLAEEVNCYILF